VDEIYNVACPASPIHYPPDPVQTTKTSVHGAINMLGLAKRPPVPIFQASTREVYGDPEVHPQPVRCRYLTKRRIACEARSYKPSDCRGSTVFPPHGSRDPLRRCHQGPRKTRLDAPISFQELVAEMVREDLQAAERDELVRNSGYTMMSHYE
jgi:hypothetical protein